MLDGRILNERYKIKKMIGGGGMADVYLGRDIILDRDVAIKVLRLEYANDDEFIARFHREAQSATSLSHPNIVNIYDVGEEDNIYYMIMEYVEGMTLKKYIQMYGPVEVEEAIDITKQITSAITHAHANEIVHRDIKPQNILIDPFGQVKVTDFGIAIALSATSLTQTNSVLGSVHYLSPEQARGGMANKKSDIYSLGIVLFELLTGRLPFSGESAVSIALKHLQSNTPSIRRWNPEIPQSVENIVLKATAKDPFHRYDAVYEMEDDLETALNPSRTNENKFIPPDDHGEATKAIPVITDEAFTRNKSTENTIIHKTGNHEPVKENGVQKGKKKRKRTAIIVSTLFLILVAAMFIALFVVPSLLQPDDVKVPDLEGASYEEAFNDLNKLGFEVNRETIYSDDIAEGFVIKTDPEAGTTLKEGDEITIFTSQGKEKVTFKNYVGEDFNQIERLLLQSGYKEVISTRENSDKPEGQIISQIQPQPNTEVVPEETNVFFVVSKGPEKVTLEDLVGLTDEEASSYLANNNLSVNIKEESSDEVPEGRVIKQTPTANTKVDEKSIVELVVSTGPEEKPPITHTVTVMVPYSGEQETTDDGSTTKEEQEVYIYIGDINNDISDLYDQDTIVEDKEYQFELVIPPGGKGEYKVVRNAEVLVDKTIKYEDLEGE
ncbi:Stk1 family PASTA domain-containing Ser/Thr kinase [Aquibacillus salsiterrae]|uniref:Serine/threonine-protein kinase PrkC n=1 Tax=Aquibacillus salsiterrae TaxID=2950439 RepID=A0A9X4AFP9_9BACI|nr:Stk1 family PASTA domain-containing Ser/Thr kinase [Aquibacillus salsiterrae]MDC3416440.1 Stk1 family PASTA domain-containing Ser/Thr kinase [Aquibacillus salsiterrae]